MCAWVGGGAMVGGGGGMVWDGTELGCGRGGGYGGVRLFDFRGILWKERSIWSREEIFGVCLEMVFSKLLRVVMPG